MSDSAPLDISPHDWLDADPDLDTQAELRALLDDPETLAHRFASRLSFGTAGLRGPLGAGPTRMNRVLVRRAAHAIGRQLQHEGLAERGVVIGYDARPKSALFAEDSARVLAWLGVPSVLIDGEVPTPVLARTALSDGHAAAIMVTASHNPRGDNGYKVYWDDGAQIRSPLDAQIEDRIDRAPLLTDADLRQQPVHRLPARVAIDRYVNGVIAPPTSDASIPGFVYTPLCGVAGATLAAALRHSGFPAYLPVAGQDLPDGSFPGLPFPNPEEPGVLDVACSEADRKGVDLVLANDPDGDRLGVAIRERGRWRQLTGDELGALLCDFLLRHSTIPNPVVASSVVSSGLVESIARSHGAAHRTTLTGFKWIIRPAIDEPDVAWVFGYEEALGFAVSDAVRDKDGISAAITLLDLVGELASRGATLGDRLDELAQEHGLFATEQVTIRVDTHDELGVMQRLREDPPTAVGGSDISDWDDWSTHEPPTRSDLITMMIGGTCRLAIRPSGTEPKVKAYLQCHTPGPFGDIADARHAAAAHLALASAGVQELLAGDRYPVRRPAPKTP